MSAGRGEGRGGEGKGMGNCAEGQECSLELYRQTRDSRVECYLLRVSLTAGEISSSEYLRRRLNSTNVTQLDTPLHTRTHARTGVP